MANLKLVTPVAPNVSAADFLEAVFDPDEMPDSETVCLAVQKPNGAFRNLALTGRILTKVSHSDDPSYFCVSSVSPKGSNDPYLKRGREQAQAAYVVGLDDIGTKATEPSLLPSYIIETSPGNFQWGYLIYPFELDGSHGAKTQYYEACINGLIKAGLSDPGAIGCYRLLRIPGSINRKPEHQGFRARIVHWAPDRVWSLKELMAELGVQPHYKGSKKSSSTGAEVVTTTGDPLLEWLGDNSELLQEGDDFYQVRCPWSHQHTDGNEAAQYSPLGAGGAEYANSRQFHCFHAHCADRNIEDYLAHTRSQGAPDVSANFNLSLEAAMAIATQLLETGDEGAWFEPNVLEALSVIKQLSTAEYQRLRAKLKKSTGVSITELERELQKAISGDPAEKLTHNGIAKALLTDLNNTDHAMPVTYYGTLYRYKDGVWAPSNKNEIASHVASSRYDGESVCKIGAHYKSIAELMFNISSLPNFFASSPKGVAAGDSFYRITTDGSVKKEPLNFQHRCRFKLPVEPAEAETPLFSGLLEAAFRSGNPLEAAEQIAVLQEVMGGVLLGLVAPLQKAVVFYGASRAGKGVLVEIIRAMLPSDTISAVSPFQWYKEYHLAGMAGKRLNLCGEFPEDNQLPAAVFKQVTGGDPLSARNPCREVFTFVADAAQLFSCNYLPYSREQSDSFYSRWQVVHFPNSISESQRDPELAKKIIAAELSGVLHWALQGAVRLVKQGGFSNSSAHDRVMAEWRLRSDSVAAFMASKGQRAIKQYEQTQGAKMPTSRFYDEYESYCDHERIKPAGKKTCFERLRSIKGVTIKHFEDGDKVVLS